MKCPSVFNQNEGQTNAHKIKCRVLIVCEGFKTEPNYFKSFHMMENSGGLVFEITNAGGGINTIKVVQKAIELRDKAIGDKKPYDITWAVFDKDSFDADKFDNAIKMANSNGIRCAWSNEAFELWYIYHFENRITPMSRNEYAHKITTLVREKQKLKTGKKSTFVYKKMIRKCDQFCLVVAVTNNKLFVGLKNKVSLLMRKIIIHIILVQRFMNLLNFCLEKTKFLMRKLEQ